MVSHSRRWPVEAILHLQPVMATYNQRKLLSDLSTPTEIRKTSKYKIHILPHAEYLEFKNNICAILLTIIEVDRGKLRPPSHTAGAAKFNYTSRLRHHLQSIKDPCPP